METCPESCPTRLPEYLHPLATSFTTRAVLHLANSDRRTLDKRFNEIFCAQRRSSEILRPIKLVRDDDPAHIFSGRAAHDVII
jgi:hypothetical protein